MKDLFKDRIYVKAAYMTGILPIKKYGTHSALNIFDEFDEETESVFIPNEEVRGEFIRAVKTGNRPELVKAIQASDELMEATLRMDEQKAFPNNLAILDFL